MECVARPGELLFVPRGWWHCALNLEVGAGHGGTGNTGVGWVAVSTTTVFLTVEGARQAAPFVSK